jgi:hypothetical protein
MRFKKKVTGLEKLSHVPTGASPAFLPQILLPSFPLFAKFCLSCHTIYGEERKGGEIESPVHILNIVNGLGLNGNNFL